MNHNVYEVALSIVNEGYLPTCVPIHHGDRGRALAIVTLRPNRVAHNALRHGSRTRRAEAHISAARESHRLLNREGLVFRCPSSS